MSGPKSGLMKIESYRLAQLQAQRDRNARIVKDACRKAHGIVDGVTCCASAMGAWGANELQKCRSLTSELEARFARFASDGYPEEAAAADEFNTWLEKKVDKELAEFQESVDAISLGMRDAEGAYQREEDRANKTRKFAGELHIKQTESFTPLLSSVDLILQRLQVLKESAGSTGPLNELLNRASMQRTLLQQLALSEAVSKKGLAALVHYVDNLRRTADAYAAHPDARLQEMRNCLNVGNDLIRHWQNTTSQIEGLYNECRTLKERCNSLDIESANLPPLWAIEDVNSLERLRDDLYRQADCGAQNAYIAYAIDEVMARHGYNVKRSVKLAALANVPGALPHSLYLNETQGAAIHVCVSPQQGTVMMETASYGPGLVEGPNGMVVDRVAPESDWERRRLVEQQQTFCSLFAQFSDELAEYGVVLNKKTDMLPSEASSVSFQAQGQSFTATQAGQTRGRDRRYEDERLAEREAR